MAKITDGTFRDWEDTEIIDAAEYKREREILKVANNDNYDRISSLEEATSGIQLGTAQLSKITNDNGAPKLSITDTSKNILTELKALGRGMHTFYAASGVISLPPTNLSIRGIAHFTDDDRGWVYATDYKNNIFTNYFDISSGWTGWKTLMSFSNEANGVASALNTMTSTGIFYVNPNTANAPTTNAGHLIVSAANPYNAFVAHTFIEMDTAVIYTRTSAASTWTSWKRMITASDTQEELWTNGVNDGWYMYANQTATPSKKLSQCRNGWILIWSDYDSAAPSKTNNFDFSYTYIPKGTTFKGLPHLFAVPNGLGSSSSSVTVKRLYVHDDKLVGHDDNNNSGSGSNDVVLRVILEW